MGFVNVGTESLQNTLAQPAHSLSSSPVGDARRREDSGRRIDLILFSSCQSFYSYLFPIWFITVTHHGQFVSVRAKFCFKENSILLKPSSSCTFRDASIHERLNEIKYRTNRLTLKMFGAIPWGLSAVLWENSDFQPHVISPNF